MPKSTPKPDLRFTVAVEPQNFGCGDRYLVVKATPMVFDVERDRPEWVWPRDYGPGGQYANFIVRAQMNAGAGPEFYGYGVRFDPGGEIDLNRAESMLKVLRALERKLKDLSDRFGYPVGFAGYMAHVATAIGMPDHCFGRRSEMSHDGYSWNDANGLRWWLAEQVKAWRKANGYDNEERAA